MSETQHDLSYNEVKLDYQALIDTAKIAYGGCIQQLTRHMNELQSMEGAYSHAGLESEWLVREAGRLHTAAKTLEVLMGGLTREDVFIVNKPKVTVIRRK